MTPLVNKTHLKEITGNDHQTFLGIIDQFHDNSTQILGQIHDAFKQGSSGEIASLSHQLKGSSGMLGMEQLYEICKKIETIDQTEIETALLDELTTCLGESIQLARDILSEA